MIEPLLLAVVRISTSVPQQPLTNASGFFFARGERLFLITSRHVLIDKPSKHFPDRLEIELHVNPENLAESTGFSILLYRDGLSVWREATDGTGEVDVAAIEIDRAALPRDAHFAAFSPEHIDANPIEVGSPILVVGFPLGFHDTLHHMPVVRQAVVASSFGLRFQGKGYFITDARTHRGTSGAPVVMRTQSGDSAFAALPWRLLGIHSARLDIGTRDRGQDEALGLNCAWYADILLALTQDAGQPDHS